MTLREYRLERGLLLREVAAVLGVRATYVSDMERGEKKLTERCCEVLRWHYGWELTPGLCARPSDVKKLRKRRGLVSCLIPSNIEIGQRPDLAGIATVMMMMALAAYEGEVPVDWRDKYKHRGLWTKAIRECYAQFRMASREVAA